MRTLAVVVALLLAASCSSTPPPSPSSVSQTNGPRTLRLDYFHTGSSTQELFSLDELVIEPAPWPGHIGPREDVVRYGAYGFDVRDAATSSLIFSGGFGSIFDEWATTEEATKVTRTFHESVRFPMPAAPAKVTIRKRGAGDRWRDMWTVPVDPEKRASRASEPRERSGDRGAPASERVGGTAGAKPPGSSDQTMFVNTAAPDPGPGAVIAIETHGESSQKVDLLLLGDGYTAAERAKFEKDARRLTDILFATSPFKERRNDFNVWGLVPAARESGISRPSQGIHRDSPIGATYDAFGSERYVLTFDNKAFRRMASYAPYDVVEIVANGRTYGGGGIYNLYSTVAADNAFAPYVFVHEFGHHFAALADEYYTSPVAYLPASSKREEPWMPNVTALLDPASLKWKDLVPPGTPLPTPWAKDAYEAHSRAIQARREELRKTARPESEMEALFTEQRAAEEAMFAKEKYAHTVGAFEGANYEARGYYRPEVNCIMFTRTDAFCAVCRRALERVIDSYVK